MVPSKSFSTLWFERRNVVYHGLAYFFNRGLPFVASLLIARFLALDDFGRYITVISFFVSLCLIVDMGFALAATSTVARRANANGEATARALLATLCTCSLMGTVMALGVLAWAEQIARWAFNDASMQGLVLAGTIYVPASALASTTTAALQGAQQYRAIAIAGLIGGAIFLAMAVGAAIFGNSLLVIWAAAFGTAARALALLVAAAPILRQVRWGQGVFAQIRTDLRELWRVALPASLAALTFAPVNSIMMSVLYRAPNGAAEAGSLGLAMQFFSIVMIAPGMLTQYALPKLSAMSGNRAMVRRKVQLKRFVTLAFAACLIIAAPIAIAAPSLLDQFGSGYSDAAPAIRWMMLAALIAAPQGVFSNFLIAVSRDWFRVMTRYLWAGVILSAVFIASIDSAQNMALIYACAWAAVLSVQIYIISRAKD